MIINFIRHGKTSGNLEKRYIGTTDEQLCSEGISELQSHSFPVCDMLAVSPMKRCIQTAELIYPSKKYIICPDFRECDFGAFEGKNFHELSDDFRYRSWIESGGENAFPEGEKTADFKNRCVAEFVRLTDGLNDSEHLSLVVHGGTIMAILERFAVPYRDYFNWQVENGNGYVTCFDGKKITVLEKI